MKKSSYIFILAIVILVGCSAKSDLPLPDQAQLTPWHTATINAPAPLSTHAQPAETPVPAPTPTPTIHIVARSETISSIALRYGLDMNAVLAANPEIDPYTLTVGTQVIIPQGNTSTQIGVSAEPLALDLASPVCTRTPEGGLWCFAMLANPLDEAADNLIVAFSLTSAGEDEAIRQTVPALLNKLDLGEALPSLVYFPSPLPADFEVSASLVSALPASQSGKTYYAVDAGSPQIELDGRVAKAAGEAQIAADPGMTVDVWVAALAFDTSGNLLGVRRIEKRVTLEAGKGLTYNLNVYSNASAISSVIIKAEAMAIK